MFNTNDILTFTVIGYDKNNCQLPFSIKLPIDENEIEDFNVPVVVDYISLFQYFENHIVVGGSKSFSIYQGKEYIGNSVFGLDKAGKSEKCFGGFCQNISDEEFSYVNNKTRYCCKVDPVTNVRKIRAILDKDDRVVPEGELKSFIIEISRIFNELNKSINKMKSLGKK